MSERRTRTRVRIAAVAALLVVATAPGAASALGEGTPTPPPFSGKPKEVSGRPSPNGAALLRPGLYTDAVPIGGETTYYLVNREHAGSTLLVGVGTLPKLEKAEVRFGLWSLEGEEWTECQMAETWRQSEGPAYFLSAVADSDALDPANRRSCAQADRLVLGIWQDGSADNFAGTPMLIAVTEEPEPTNTARMTRTPAEIPTWITMAAPPETGAATGAERIEDAPDLDEGAYTSQIRPGQFLFYRVDVGWGQRLQAHVRVDRPDPTTAALIDEDSPDIGVTLVGPTLGRAGVHQDDLGLDSQTELESDAAVEVFRSTPEVRWANRLRNPDLDDVIEVVDATTIAGPYFVGITLSENSYWPEDQTLPFTLQVGLEGTTGVAPKYPAAQKLAGPAWPEPKPKPKPKGTSPTAPGEISPLVVGGSGLALFAAGLTALVLLRRGRNDPGTIG